MALNQQIFLKRSKDKHGEKYSYEHAVYTTLYKKVTITCPFHGFFTQVASDHMSGNGCQKCARIRIASKRKGKKFPRKKPPTEILTKIFVNKARKVHKDFYDYTSTVFNDWNEKVVIKCPVHGFFSQKATDHVHGKNGCQKCGLAKRGQYRRLNLTTNSFIDKANIMHNSVYDYSKLEINSTNYSTDKVPIVCKWHGIFYQSIRLHLKGHGCKRCAHEYTKGVSRNVINCNQKCNVYLLKLLNDKECFYKIGITICNVKSRVSSIPYQIEILDTITVSPVEAFNIEQNLLQKYKEKRYIPLKLFGGWSECFDVLPSTSILEL